MTKFSIKMPFFEESEIEKTMLCQKCGKNTATMHWKQVVNGQMSEQYLCSACAEGADMGFSASLDSGKIQGLDSFFSNFFTDGLFTATSVGSGQRARKSCPLCGATMRDFAKSGKVGCAKCYEVFSEELRPTVIGIHGRAKHIGRAPGGHREQMERRRKIEELTRRQAQAVEEQDYEQAAALRDEIRALRQSESQ